MDRTLASTSDRQRCTSGACAWYRPSSSAGPRGCPRVACLAVASVRRGSDRAALPPVAGTSCERSAARSGRRERELHFAHVHRGTHAWCLGGVHRAEDLRAGLHVLESFEVLQDHGRSLTRVKSISSRVLETPGGGPPDSVIRERAPLIRSALTSVNLTTRTYTATTLSFAVLRP